MVKNLPANAGDAGLISVSGRCTGGGDGNALPYSCLGNPMDSEAGWATAHGAAKGRTQHSNYTRRTGENGLLEGQRSENLGLLTLVNSTFPCRIKQLHRKCYLILVLPLKHFSL